MSNRATPTRIMFCNYTTFPGGGIETVTSLLAEYLSERGYEIYLMTGNLREGLLTATDRRCIKQFIVSPHKNIDREQTISWMAQQCNYLAIDIFVLQDIPLAKIASLRELTPNTKFVFCYHNTPLWRVQIKLARHTLSAANSFVRRLILPLTTPLKRLLWRQRYANVERRTIALCDATVALCESYRASLATLVGSSKGLFAIENGTAHRDRLVDVERQKQLLYVGRLSMAAKRVDRLLRIWSLLQEEFADWSLELVGDGPDRARLEAMAQELGLERVTWHGWTTEPTPFYARAAVTCLTSEFEGWPMTFGEAMQQGSIAAAFNVSAGVAELVGDAGLLVEPYDEAAYAEALRGVMRDEKLRAELSDRAVAQAGRFTVERMGQKYIEMFDYVLNR